MSTAPEKSETAPRTGRSGTDITQFATAESRRKGSLARSAAIHARKEAARSEAEAKLATKLERAVERLGELLESDAERVALAAANSIADRILGRAAQPLTGADGGPIAFASEEAERMREQLASKVAQLSARRSLNLVPAQDEASA